MSERIVVYLEHGPTPRRVGELSDVGTGPHFQYDAAFLQSGLELSPFTLRLGPQVFVPGRRELKRLQGLVYDALPDGWGLKLLHQAMKNAKRDVNASSPVTWLRALGTRSMGAITFRPPIEGADATLPEHADLERLAEEARRVDAEHVEDVLPALIQAGAPSGGARPKIVVGWHDSGAIVDAFDPLPPDYRPVLIKFAARTDPADAPLVEVAYLTMAAAAGIEVPAHRAHPLAGNRWAFVVDRFDRDGDRRIHVHTLAGLAEIDIKTDAPDYRDLLEVAKQLTRDHRAVRAAWQRAVFNVGAHNRDDHARNVAFRMDTKGTWTLAPAYDLTFMEGPGGYHNMAVDDESANPTRVNLLRLAEKADITTADANEGLDQVRAALSQWPTIAADAGVSAARIREIGARIDAQSDRLAPVTVPAPKTTKKR